MSSQTTTCPNCKVDIDLPPPEMPTAVITVRMVPSLHNRIRETAQREGISINGLCLGAVKYALDKYDKAAEARAAKPLQPQPPPAGTDEYLDHIMRDKDLQTSPATA